MSKKEMLHKGKRFSLWADENSFYVHSNCCGTALFWGIGVTDHVFCSTCHIDFLGIPAIVSSFFPVHTARLWPEDFSKWSRTWFEDVEITLDD